MSFLCKAILVFGVLFSLSSSASSCENRVFDIGATAGGVTPMEVLSQLSSECNFAISIKDETAKTILEKPMSSFSLVRVPFLELLNIIIKERNLNYKYTGNLLKISYYQTKTFKLNYISSSRTSESSTGVTISGNTDNAAGSNGGGGASESQGITQTTIKSSDIYSFWTSIEKELRVIVLGASTQPTMQAGSPEGEEVVYTNQGGSSIVINSGAGLITVTGTNEEIQKAEEYLDKIKESLHASVMIDVSILKVQNSDSKSIGIDWDQLLNLQNINVNYAASGIEGGNYGDGRPSGYDEIVVGYSQTGFPIYQTVPTYDTTTNTYPASTENGAIQSAIDVGTGLRNVGAKSFGYSIISGSISLTRVVDFMKKYGDVSSVSNPKVITLNNQPALISVGDIIRYESDIVYQASGTGGTTQNTATQYPSVFAGILLDITPSIDGEDVILRINPSVTGTKGIDVDSQSTALKAPPNLTTNQLSSLVKVKDGDMIILGGLIKKSNSMKENKVPLLGDIPILGYAFKREESAVNTEEMVIVITPHIVKSNEENTIGLKDLGYSIVPSILESEHNQTESQDINKSEIDG